MDVEELLKKARAVEARVLQFKKFWEDLVGSSNSIKNEETVLIKQLSKLNLEVSELQIKKIELDKITHKVEMDVETATENIKSDYFLKTHRGLLNQRKQLLEECLLGKGLDLEDIRLQRKIDSVWTYFTDKNFELDNDIAREESTLASRQACISNMYAKGYNDYKKSIEKLQEENNLLSKKVNLISRFQDH